MKPIAETAYYRIEVDPNKNRLYLTLWGFWKNLEVAPHFLEDIGKVAHLLQPGFTALANVSQLKPTPQEVKVIHEKAQKILLHAGLRKTAEVIPDDTVVQVQIDDFAKQSKMPKREFYTQEEAENWLNQTCQ